MNIDDVVSFILSIISQTEGGINEEEKWTDLESSHGKVDYEILFEDLFEINDKDGDYDFVANRNVQEDFTNNIKSFLYINNLFKNWIKTIKIAKQKMMVLVNL